jgi:hypothetical protein
MDTGSSVSIFFWINGLVETLPFLGAAITLKNKWLIWQPETIIRKSNKA